MNEDTILTIKWLNSDDSDEWRAGNIARVYRPLVALIPDNEPSDFAVGCTDWQVWKAS